jgi:hypothetical protein
MKQKNKIPVLQEVSECTTAIPCHFQHLALSFQFPKESEHTTGVNCIYMNVVTLSGIESI